jgi:DMSO/TMAO reductase YedYZ molybdopterin-dependent catalytic subunit
MNKRFESGLFSVGLCGLIFGTLVVVTLLPGCSPLCGPRDVAGVDSIPPLPFPDFITANQDYFITRIGEVPVVNADSFRLEIIGLVDTPRGFSLQELMALPLITMPLTVECQGNSPNSDLVATAVWRGFRLYDLLASLGLDSGATGVKYRCADGYYATHTMDQIKNNNVIGALIMNDVTLPPEQGFPLRILSPGYYGVKQPAWVVGIEVSGQPPSDYWSDRGWDVSPPMDVDSKIFFPLSGDTAMVGKTLYVGGAAYGGTRIAGVEVSANGGNTWTTAQIVKSMDSDNVWVFWVAKLVPRLPGEMLINARATDIHGMTQPETDTAFLDGSNSWPSVTVPVVE